MVGQRSCSRKKRGRKHMVMIMRMTTSHKKVAPSQAKLSSLSTAGQINQTVSKDDHTREGLKQLDHLACTKEKERKVEKK